MHQVLFIREILLDIFEYCLPVSLFCEWRRSKPNLAALARTCQIFKEPALDLLWRELSDLSPLARCLPEACRFDDGCYSFCRPLIETEWKTLRGYTRRVRSISSSSMHDNRVALFLAASTDPLFPNLRSLNWRDSRTLPVVHIAVPSLTSLCLVCTRPSKRLPTELFDTIGKRCPDIKWFSASLLRSGLDTTIILRQLCRWTSLQRVDCEDIALSTDFILHLPSLSTLKQLSFTLSPDLGNYATHLGSMSVLSNLTDLKIRSTSLKSVTTLFSHIQLPKIKDLDVIVLEYTPRLGLQEYWTTVQRACLSNTLARLAFSSHFNRADLSGLHEQAPSCLTLVDLLPYKDFGNLRKIAIDVAWSVNLTDADILDLVSTSPHLEELSINNSWGWRMDREGGITLHGLVQLLRQCPFLGHVSLVIDMRTFTRIPPGLDVSFPPRKTYPEMLSLNRLGSKFVPELYMEYASVFKALELNVWSSIIESDDGDSEESQDSADDYIEIE